MTFERQFRQQLRSPRFWATIIAAAFAGYVLVVLWMGLAMKDLLP